VDSYHEGDDDAEEAEAEGGHQESRALFLLLRTQNNAALSTVRAQQNICFHRDLETQKIEKVCFVKLFKVFTINGVILLHTIRGKK